MHNSTPRKFSLLMCLFISAACASSAQTPTSGDLVVLNAELANVRAERDMLKNKVIFMGKNLERERDQWLDSNYELKVEIKELQNTNRKLAMSQSSYDTLKDQHQRLENWNKALIQGYGPGIWVINEDLIRPLYNRKPKVATVKGIVDELNEGHKKYNNPLLILQKIEDKTVYLGVSDGLKLSDGMGTSGADYYIHEALYSLYSLSEVNCVQWDFEEGSHATPGKHCK